MTKDIYLGDFESKDDVQSQFDVSDKDFEGVQIIVAEYEQGNYDGEAYVLFKKDHQLYEVYGSHCSCFGLEQQWEPEEVTIDFLKNCTIRKDSKLDETITKYLQELDETSGHS